ncbi:probable beta-1,3-galactosyltransferase 1 isoform X3 [Gossypium raimondii]|uniref:probable beta-1,3-galactosyltransferase 1 isoform X3 n=1 Tax=Gossypium raimondii TaxID=29730 RepID=UPI00063A9134|nr:probable beta-1,3-galactosyltransferase 1 isoform X3 [Gossypium raimondii]
MFVKSRGEHASKHVLPKNLALLLCFASFCAGMFFSNRTWMVPDAKGIPWTSRTGGKQFVDYDPNIVLKNEGNNSGDISGSQHSILTMDKAISDLEIKLMASRAERETIQKDPMISEGVKNIESTLKRKYFMVIGINTAFSSHKRRDSVRATWMPQAEKRKKLEEETGIIIRFVIGHSSTSGGILDKAIEAEEKVHGDFLRLQQHVEGYLELSAKTKTYFATAVSLWDAEFYVKVDDDIHVNLATLGVTLARHSKKPRVYIGCMKSGPVLARKGVKYHEPEYWKFGEVGNKYFRHATGQLYAISKDLATYIFINQNVLHKYANEDVSLGAWFIGLDVEHVDDRRLCCGTPPDCEWKAQAGNICAASFDWRCSGICRSVERIMEVHERCGEDKNALWSANFVQTIRTSS